MTQVGIYGISMLSSQYRYNIEHHCQDCTLELNCSHCIGHNNKIFCTAATADTISLVRARILIKLPECSALETNAVGL